MPLITTDKTKNIHNEDHVATCLCCKLLEEDFDGGYSEMTPGEGFVFTCKKKHFYMMSTYQWHDLMQGSHCPDFVGT